MITFPKISITGDLGSGKSAVSRLLQQETGFEIFSTGKIQREIAARRSMTTLELNKYAETHPEIDEEIDNFSKSLGKRDVSVIVDSRMAWFFIPNSFKIYLQVEPEEAARRILGDNNRQSEAYQDLNTAKAKIMARKQSENARFLQLYGVDCGDMTNFDLVADTTEKTPEQVLGLILTEFKLWCT